jgi:hypothetical protein
MGSFFDREEPMKKCHIRSLAAVAALICLAVPMATQAAGQAGTQDKPVDMKKLLAEIIGEYEFALPGMTMTIQFTQREGQLYGAPVGEPEEQIHPVQGKPLCFDVTVADGGEYYFLEFVRNDKGVIDKCRMTSQGETFEGAKIIK